MDWKRILLYLPKLIKRSQVIAIKCQQVLSSFQADTKIYMEYKVWKITNITLKRTKMGDLHYRISRLTIKLKQSM